MEQIAQGTPEWKQLRCGKITGSKIADVMSKGKKGAESTGYANYRAQLACERLTGCVTDTYSNGFMQRGNEDEAAARLCYEFLTGNEVQQVPFIKHPTLDFAGSSPDGLIGEDGHIEIKRKIPAIHAAYILKNEVPAEYRKQMMFQLACSGRKWNDFVSYCPEMPEELQIFIVRMHRDEELITEIETAVVAFNDAVEKMIEDLKNTCLTIPMQEAA